LIGQRIAIIGNAGGGKSTLARRLAASHDLPLTEVDKLLWQPGWKITPEEEYDALHQPLIDSDCWIIEGMGHLHSIRPRLLRATWIIVIDMPIWMHFWLAAERQIEQALGTLEHPVAGLGEPIPTRDMFETLWETEQDWMPTIRADITEAEAAGIRVTRLDSVDAIDAFRAEHAPD
jgi:adenylate kinase family enzyme